MNYCHCLWNCNCFAFNIAKATVGWVHWLSYVKCCFFLSMLLQCSLNFHVTTECSNSLVVLWVCVLLYQKEVEWFTVKSYFYHDKQFGKGTCSCLHLNNSFGGLTSQQDLMQCINEICAKIFRSDKLRYCKEKGKMHPKMQCAYHKNACIK